MWCTRGEAFNLEKMGRVLYKIQLQLLKLMKLMSFMHLIFPVNIKNKYNSHMWIEIGFLLNKENTVIKLTVFAHKKHFLVHVMFFF